MRKLTKKQWDAYLEAKRLKDVIAELNARVRECRNEYEPAFDHDDERVSPDGKMIVRASEVYVKEHVVSAYTYRRYLLQPHF